jgi:murein DD-endopeptidase MepM/ murein hydrolase activator NlpD
MDNQSNVPDFLQKFVRMLAEKGMDINSIGQTISQLLFPVEGNYNVTQGFGNYNPSLYGKFGGAGKHLGTDLATPVGTMVRSPISGQVKVGYDPKGYGRYVDVIGDDGTTYRMSHLSALERALERGGRVEAGQTIAKTGGVGAGSGNSTGAHLDYSVKKNGQWIDPMSLYQRG